MFAKFFTPVSMHLSNANKYTKEKSKHQILSQLS